MTDGDFLVAIGIVTFAIGIGLVIWGILHL